MKILTAAEWSLVASGLEERKKQLLLASVNARPEAAKEMLAIVRDIDAILKKVR